MGLIPCQLWKKRGEMLPIVSRYSGVSPARHRVTTTAVKHIVDDEFAGDFVEYRIFRGDRVRKMVKTRNM